MDTLGLTEGQTYPLDLFYAERHTTEANFRVETSIVLIPVTKAKIVAAGDANKVTKQNGAFKVQLDKDAPAGGLTVNYEIVSSGTNGAQSDVDFTPLSGQVTISAGKEALIPVVPKGSLGVNATKPLTLKLKAGDGRYEPDLASATINIIDKAPALVAKIVAAGDANKVTKQNGAFKVQLDKDVPSGGLTIGYEIVPGGANAAQSGVDFNPLSGQVTIASGKEAVITVTPKDTLKVDAAKPLTLKLKAGTGYQPDSATATINIVDKAPAQPTLPTVSVSSGGDAQKHGSAIQGGQCRFTPATNSFFTITRTSEKSDQPLEVKFSIGGTAELNNDYEMPGFSPSSVTIAAGQTSVKLPINPKIAAGLRNKDMTITVTLQEVGGQYRLGNSNASLTLKKGDRTCAVQP